MLRWLLVLLALGLSALSANSYWQSRDSGYNIAVNVATGCTPTCVGDLSLSSVSWVDWYSTGRCFSHTFTGPIIDIADTSTGTTTGSRINCAANGVVSVDSGTNCAWVTGTSQCSPIATTCATACAVKVWYSQVPSPTFGNFTAVVGSRQAFKPTALNSTGCVSITSASIAYDTANSATQNQPFAMSTIMLIHNTSALGGVVSMFGNQASTVRAGPDNSGPPADHMAYAGQVNAKEAASDNTFHALNDTFNGTSSIVSVDGSATSTLNGGTNNISANQLALGRIVDANLLTGYLCEAGLSNGAMNTTDMGTLSTNQHAAYGTW